MYSKTCILNIKQTVNTQIYMSTKTHRRKKQTLIPNFPFQDMRHIKEHAFSWKANQHISTYLLPLDLDLELDLERDLDREEEWEYLDLDLDHDRDDEWELDL